MRKEKDDPFGTDSSGSLKPPLNDNKKRDPSLKLGVTKKMSFRTERSGVRNLLIFD
jgi:hypothetical protein